MGLMFCDLHVSLNNPSSGDINSSNLPFFFVGGGGGSREGLLYCILLYIYVLTLVSI